MRSAAASLHKQLGGVADLVLCFCTEQHHGQHVEAAAQKLFNSVPFAANTSHGGVVTESGAARVGPAGCPAILALWGIRDAAGAFAVAAVPVEEDMDYAHATASAATLTRAEIIRQTGSDIGGDMTSRHASEVRRRTGSDIGGNMTGHRSSDAIESETSLQRRQERAITRRHDELLWLLTAPGNEEVALRELQQLAGSNTVVLGSSSADEHLVGHWWQLACSPGKPEASACFSHCMERRAGTSESAPRLPRPPIVHSPSGPLSTHAPAIGQPPCTSIPARTLACSIRLWLISAVALRHTAMAGDAAEGVVIVHFAPSVDFIPVFSHGYSPTVHRATVVANGGENGTDVRVLRQLSVRGGPPEPAADVYNR